MNGLNKSLMSKPMNKPVYKVQKSAQKGVAILETLIALVIFSMGILALVGLQASMLRNTAESKYRSDANYIAQQAVGRMWAGKTVSQVIDGVNASNLLPNGSLTIDNTSAPEYVVTVAWTAPGETVASDGACATLGAHCFTTTATIAGITP